MGRSDTILLIDDHPLFRQGLKNLLSTEFPQSDISEAGSLAEARSLVSDKVPDIVILDITLPDGDGVSFAKDYVTSYPASRVYILTMHRRSGLLRQARDAGCKGYFLKEGDGKTLIESLHLDDDKFRISETLGDLYKSLSLTDERSNLYDSLTPREREVFKLLIKGAGYKEVAWDLGISSRTAAVHRYKVFQKLKISNEVELVKVAQDMGFFI